MTFDIGVMKFQENYYEINGTCSCSNFYPPPSHEASLSRFHDHTQTHSLCSIPLDERSARRRDFYMATHDIHNRQTSMPSAGFDTAIPASERPQSHALDRSATRISCPLQVPCMTLTMSYTVVAWNSQLGVILFFTQWHFACSNFTGTLRFEWTWNFTV